MKTIETIMRAGAVALALTSGGHAFAASCHELLAGGTYACVSDPNDELPEFTLVFDAEAEHVTSPQLSDPLTCFCSSTGSVGKPNVEAGPIVACASSRATSATLLTARAKRDDLAQGTLASVALGAREGFPFFCERVP